MFFLPNVTESRLSTLFKSHIWIMWFISGHRHLSCYATRKTLGLSDWGLSWSVLYSILVRVLPWLCCWCSTSSASASNPLIPGRIHIYRAIPCQCSYRNFLRSLVFSLRMFSGSRETVKVWVLPTFWPSLLRISASLPSTPARAGKPSCFVYLTFFVTEF